MKIHFCDAVALFLSYRYFSHESTTVPYREILGYEKILLNNLKGVAHVARMEENPYRYSFFSLASKENGTLYAILNVNSHTEEDLYAHLNEIPIELFIASQMQNALEFVGITIQDGEFLSLQSKESGIKFTRKKQLIS